jgi:hypothetical protein
MPSPPKKISLIYFVIVTLLLVGLVPLVLTGWFLSKKSGDELRAVENRYQTQLVQEKARQIEMFGQRYSDLVLSFAEALELSDNLSILSSPQPEKKLGNSLKENQNLLSLYIKPIQANRCRCFAPRQSIKTKSKRCRRRRSRSWAIKKCCFHSRID